MTLPTFLSNVSFFRRNGGRRHFCPFAAESLFESARPHFFQEEFREECDTTRDGNRKGCTQFRSNLISSVPRRRLGWIEKLRGEKREINSLGGETRNNVLAALVTQFGGK